MKHFYIFLLLLAGPLVFAQDLFSNVWYLTRLSIDGVDYYPPTNNEVPNITLSFESFLEGIIMQTNVCNTLWGQIDLSMNGDAFTFHDSSQTFIECNLPANAFYEMDYFTFYTQFTFSTTFTYNITESDGVKTLDVNATNSSRQAVYSNVMLATNGFSKPTVSIFPNPATDFITINTNGIKTGTNRVEIYSALGNCCKSESFDGNQKKLDTSDLSRGMYIVKIKTESETITGKFLKM